MAVCGSGKFCYDLKSYDVIILLLGTKESPEELKLLLATSISTEEGSQIVGQYFLSMFKQDAHSM